MADLHTLNAADGARRIAARAISSEDLTAACLDRIATREPDVRAWQFLDREQALAQARQCDTAQRSGAPIGRLHGVPVGIKDIFDTADMPTEYGSPLYAGHRPRSDSGVVARLRADGAVILGKTVTTEFAARLSGKTRNPHDLDRTPGGSSSGSAAAVADSTVPLALGSQTVGSTLRPASFCGVVGYKPSFGLIGRSGMYPQSRFLDHVGLIARTVGDVAILAEVVGGPDAGDPDTGSMTVSGLRANAILEPPFEPRLAFVKSPFWDRADPETQSKLGSFVEKLGALAVERTLPPNLSESRDCIFTILECDVAHNLNREYERGRDRLSDSMRAMIEFGRRRTAFEYLTALDRARTFRDEIDRVFADCDAVVTLATTGVAPLGLADTGDPIFCALWTLCGLPAITLPLLRGEAGLPLGVQLVGRRGGDVELLRTAHWLSVNFAPGPG